MGPTKQKARIATPPLEGSDAATSRTRIRAEKPAEPTRAELDRLRFELTDKYAAGDFAAALLVAEELHEKNPEDLTAGSFARDCRRMLEQQYCERLGSLQSVVALAITLPQLRRRSLDHRAGFLLSRVDGQSPVEVLLDVGAMPRLDALRILCDLLDDGILRVVER
jgi:hypothetical protein